MQQVTVIAGRCRPRGRLVCFFCFQETGLFGPKMDTFTDPPTGASSRESETVNAKHPTGLPTAGPAGGGDRPTVPPAASGSLDDGGRGIRISGTSWQVSSNGALGYVETQHLHLAVDAGCSPGKILRSHSSNQITDLDIHRWTTRVLGM